MTFAREVAAVAHAELRSVRRLSRTWLFSAVVLLLGMAAFAAITGLHGFFGAESASAGLLTPRFLMAAVGAQVTLGVFSLALVFLAFDVRARDAKDRLAEVLDARPVGNFALLLGRLIGLVLSVWFVVALLALVWQGLGLLALATDLPVGEPIEPLSLAALVLVDAPAYLAMWCALVILISVVARNRLVTAIVCLALLGLWMWAPTQVPTYLMPMILGVTSATAFPSDLVSVFVPAWDLAHRGCELLLAGGFLTLAAALHPRPDARARTPGLAIGTLLILLGGAGIALLMAELGEPVENRAAWRAFHEAHRDDPKADVVAVTGSVKIDPGRELVVALDYRLRIPGDAASIAFSLNPGMRPTSVLLNGAPADFRHESGLLQVDATAPPGAATLSIAAEGVPDAAFAYLDGEVDGLTMPTNENLVAWLGTQASIFHDDYVALMPGAYWMPLPGVAVDRDDPAYYGKDYFELDLAVEAPASWLVAGPGRREGQAGLARFRPGAPLPEVALFAAPFARAATEVAGVELELLTHPAHGRNVAFFSDAAEEIEQRVGELLESAERMGLGYPYGGLSVVEVPTNLRVYGGGWRMDSVLSLPGIVAMRENGWPTARFESRFSNPERFEDQEGGLAVAKRRVLDRAFHQDITGGNPLHGGVRNLLAFVAGARGEGAAALDFVLHDLAVQLITNRRSGWFSPYSFDGAAGFGRLMAAFAQPGTGSIAGRSYLGETRRAPVRDRALGASLAELDPTEDPQVAANVLWLKGPEIAQAIRFGVGREAAAAMLAELRRRHLGGNFTAADLNAAAAAVGVDLAALLGDWLHDAALPGFVVSPLAIERLQDDDQGRPRYQLRVSVRNEEPVPGLVRLRYEAGRRGTRVEDATAPVRVAGRSSVDIGLVSNQPPHGVELLFFLSLNRDQRRALTIPQVDQTERLAAEPFAGWRVSEWRPAVEPGVVVDDLDAGFVVRYEDERAMAQLTRAAAPPGARLPEADIDQGLPVYGAFPPVRGWARQPHDRAWGKYRRTLARAARGPGNAVAEFLAEIPAPGRWRLGYHLPSMRSERRGDTVLGSYDLRVVAGGEETLPFRRPG